MRAVMRLLFNLKSLFFISFVFSLFVSLSAQAGLKVIAYQKYNTMKHFNPDSYGYMDQLVYKLIRVQANGGLQLLTTTEQDLIRLVELKKQHEKVELLIGVGGAKLNSKHFPALAAHSTSRKHFAQQLIKFCKKYNLDGVDLDWEYPETEEDQHNAIKLFKELYFAFKQADLILTAAVTYTPEQVDFAKQIEPYVAQINLMIYEPKPGLFSFEEQIDYAVKLVAEKQLPVDKLVMGLPFYGKNFQQGGFRHYRDLVKQHESGFSFLNQSQIIDYTKLFKKQNYFGVMFWELGFDAPLSSTDSLLRSIYQNAH